MKGQILEILMKKYNKTTLTKKEVAKELGLSLRTIDSMMKDGHILPSPLKLGSSKTSSVRFNIVDVAILLADTISDTLVANERIAKEKEK